MCVSVYVYVGPCVPTWDFERERQREREAAPKNRNQGPVKERVLQKSVSAEKNLKNLPT